MKTTDAIIVIVIFSITAVLIIAFVMYFLPKGDVPRLIENSSEKARFIRYMTCSLAACVGGCDSSHTYALPLESGEGDKPSLGCNQLLHELGHCTGANVGQKLCDRSYALNFTFKEETDYIGNYSVSWDNPGPCSPHSQSGLQTDTSCLRYFRDYIECACLSCPIFGDVYPEGRIVRKTDGCGYAGGEQFGSIYVSDGIPITCELADNVGISNGLGKCTFDEGRTIFIWAENAGTTFNYCTDFGLCGGPPLGWCGGLNSVGCQCQKIVLCENS